MVIELSIRLKHECPFLEFSMNFGKKTIYHYCSSINDYLVIPGKVTDELKELAHILFGRFDNLSIKEIGENPDFTYIYMDCPCNDILRGTSIAPKIRELNGVPIYPTTYQNGFEYYRIYCKNNVIADNFIEQMKQTIEFEVLSKEDLGDDWIVTQTAVLKQLVDLLTPVQREILQQAFEGGYYNIPRNLKLETLAERNSKSRWAIEKSIRKAENKILNYLMPFFYLHQSDIHVKPVVYEKFPMKIEI